MKLKWVGLAAAMLLIAACKPRVEEANRPTVSKSPPIPVARGPATTDQPTIQFANWEESQQLVAQNAGKVVILDLWASW